MSGFIYDSVAMGLSDAPINGASSGSLTGMSTTYGSESPLKLFVVAKRHINETYLAIYKYAEESRRFLSEGQTVVTDAKVVLEVKNLVEKVVGIKEVLSRDHMKVAFFGRTSNGKSSVINAVLHNKILPAGMGHTTNCFLQVEGSDSSEPYLVSENSPDVKQSMDTLAQMGNALTSDNMGDSTLVRIFWPKTMCTLLRDDVVLMDSPGIDVSANLDEWIDKHCLDADVFVFVSNAEATIMRTETAFFHKVSEKLSKPNIFILNNRWDAVASEPEYLDLVRKQHMDRDTAFFCDELKVVDRNEVEDRVFFVSAKEALQLRLNKPPVPVPEGFQHRYREFEEFERKFEECLSKSAVKTKFDQHTKAGKKIISELRSLLDEVHKRSAELKTSKITYRKDLHEKLVSTQHQMQTITNEIKHQICHLVEQVEVKVCSALNEEIRRLSLLVSDYEKPFNADPLVLSVYKKELHSHVERGLGSNLRARLSTALICCVDSAQTEMTSRVCGVLTPTEKNKQNVYDLKSRQSFEVFYPLNCESLCADFQEDLEFRFSLGLISMIRRFTNKNPFKKDSIPRSLPPTAPQTPSNEGKMMTTAAETENLMIMLVEKMTVAAPQSQTTIGALALGGFMVRTIGWRIIAITCGVYGVLYLYERLTWTNKAKERTFKRQYVNHATRKLKLIVDLTSANCSHQVQQELTRTFARLCRLVDEVVNDMNMEIGELDQEIKELSGSADNAQQLRDKAKALLASLEKFSDKYLSFENQSSF